MWYAFEVTIESAAREALEYGLMEAGALGTETAEDGAGAMRVTGYFDGMPELEAVRAAVHDALRIYEFPASSVREIERHAVETRDWLGEWKKSWQPVAVGERFVIAPPWSEVAAQPDRVVIRIEPGMAFGTGTHETTRLCLAALEKHFVDGGTLFDVGTGTGILAIAAAKLHGNARVEACDTDADAVRVARENARLNGVAAQISFRTGTVEETGASFDCVCANLTADVILPLLPALIGATCGRLILSGILDTQAASIRTRLAELGVTDTETVADGEWVAIVI